MGTLRLANIRGVEMYLDPEDSISGDLKANGIREPYITREFLNHCVCPGDVVVDIGANIGYYALQEARLVGRQGLVYAIEPVPVSLSILNSSIIANGFSNIKTCSLAIGDSNRDDFINVSAKRNWCSMAKTNHGHNFTGKIPVKVMTLDKFLRNKREPDIIRMDVEGYEYEVVKGMTELLKSKVPLVLFIEMHFNILRDKTVVLCQTLKDAGFGVAVATLEPHPAVWGRKWGQRITDWLDKQIGLPQGKVSVCIDDFIHNPMYRNGQIEWLEVIFRRG